MNDLKNSEIFTYMFDYPGSFLKTFIYVFVFISYRFTDEEMKLLLRLVTSQPPINQSGARFVSLGLCMLIACPYIIGYVSN